MASTCHYNGGPSVRKGSANDKQSPNSSCFKSAPFGNQRPPTRPTGVHHAGVVLFACAMLRFFQGRLGDHLQLQAQWLGQILQGAVNIEQSRLVTAEDLARLIGPADVSIAAQREALFRLASRSTVTDVYAANAALLSDGPGKDRVFYYDPHSKQYTGELKVLKDWCGRRHGVAKVMHLDMIHTRSGRPCFLTHYSPYYDLRERFFMTLAQFDELFCQDQRSNRVFIIDRGIYGIDTFARFIDSGDHFLTWEKDYRRNAWQEGADTQTFVRVRPRNNAKDLRRYTFSCQQQKWHRDERVRRIIARATNPNGRTIEVSVLCSDPELSLKHAVWLMFERWLQENSFKYLDKHFGLNQLTSYQSRAVSDAGFDDKDIDSIEYRELKAELRAVESALAKCLLQREKAADKLAAQAALHKPVARQLKQHRERLEKDVVTLRADDELFGSDKAGKRRKEQMAQAHRQGRKVRNACERLHKKLAKLAATIEQLKAEAENLQMRLCETIRKQSRLQVLIDNQYRLLDARCKALLDAVRVTAANMFLNLLEVFRPIYGNYRNDHLMLRNLTRGDGFMHVTDQTLHIRLWLKGRFQPWQLTAFATVLAEMTELINAASAGRAGAVPIRIALVHTSPTL